MTYNPEQQKEQIINKFVYLSEQYHKLSLLFYELSRSLTLESKRLNYKQFKEYIKNLNLDIDKLKVLSKGLSNLELKDIKKEVIK